MKLSIPIIAGKTTCASEPGKFCQFVGTIRFGQEHVCRLFPSENNSHTRLESSDGWLQRLPECIAAEGKDDDPHDP